MNGELNVWCATVALSLETSGTAPQSLASVCQADSGTKIRSLALAIHFDESNLTSTLKIVRHNT